MKYKLVAAKDTKEMEQEVTNLLEQGWKPTGGVTVVHGGNQAGPDHTAGRRADVLVQAMVLHEPIKMRLGAKGFEEIGQGAPGLEPIAPGRTLEGLGGPGL